MNISILNIPVFLQIMNIFNNESYQNFLLTSIENRKKLQEKVRSGSKERIRYE